MFRSTLAVLASTSAILISVPARAADLPSPVQPLAPVAYAPSFSWTGFYVGGELGWIGTDPEYTAGVVLLGAPFIYRHVRQGRSEVRSYGRLQLPGR